MNIIKTILIGASIIVFTACGGGGQPDNSNTGSGNHTQNNNDNTGGQINSGNGSGKQTIRVKKHTYESSGVIERFCEYEYYNDSYRFLKKKRCQNNPDHPLYLKHTTYQDISTYKYDAKGFLKDSHTITYKFTDSDDKEKTGESNSKNTYEGKTWTIETSNMDANNKIKTKEVNKYTYSDNNFKNMIKSISTTYDAKGNELRRTISEHNSIQEGNKLESHTDSESYENNTLSSKNKMSIYFEKTESGDLAQNKILIKATTFPDNDLYEYTTTFDYDGKYDKFEPSIPMGIMGTTTEQKAPRMVASKSYERIYKENGKIIHKVNANYTNTYTNNFIKHSEYIYSKYHFSNSEKLEEVYADTYEYY